VIVPYMPAWRWPGGSRTGGQGSSSDDGRGPFGRALSREL